MIDSFIKSGFVKVINNNKKIGLRVYNKKTNQEYMHSYDFESNKVFDVNNTDIKFAIACSNENDNSFLFLINQGFNAFNKSVSSPIRTWFPYLVPSVFDKMSPYVFSDNNENLKIDTDGVYYVEVMIINL